MANFIFNELKRDPYVFVRTSTNDSTVTFDIKFGSVHFLDGKAVLTEEPVWCNIEDTKTIPDANRFFNFSLPLRRPFALIFGCQYPNIDSTTIVEFDAADIRWTENSYMWSKIIQSIHDYESQPRNTYFNIKQN